MPGTPSNTPGGEGTARERAGLDRSSVDATPPDAIDLDAVDLDAVHLDAIYLDAIYLDHAATTPLDPVVLDAMLPWLGAGFGNASSRHARGRRAATAVEEARAAVAGVLGADPREVVFTSGATEACNLALRGPFASPAYRGRRHLVTVRTEHRAVLDAADRLETHEGVRVTRLPVGADGRLDLDRLVDALAPDTLMVSVMHANNEIGVVQDVEAIGALCRARGVLFHTDATQSFGKLELDVDRACIDLLSLSGHKVHGPQGVGALYVRRRPRARVEPLLHGGGHERGLRPGTLNVPGIVGLGAASRLVADPEVRAAEAARVGALRDRLERALGAGGADDLLVHAATAPRLPGLTNVAFQGVDADRVLERVADRVAASTASACTSASRQPSYVLGALGMPDAVRRGSLRLSLGRTTTADEIDRAAAALRAAVADERASGRAPDADAPCEL